MPFTELCAKIPQPSVQLLEELNEGRLVTSLRLSDDKQLLAVKNCLTTSLSSIRLNNPS